MTSTDLAAVRAAAILLHDWFADEDKCFVYKTYESHPWSELNDYDDHEQKRIAATAVCQYLLASIPAEDVAENIEKRRQAVTRHRLPRGTGPENNPIILWISICTNTYRC